MSADDGIFVCRFPVRDLQPYSKASEYRVCYASMSVMDELESPWVSGAEYPEIVKGMFKNSPVFADKDEATVYASKESESVGYTEYGICYVDFSVPFGEKREDIPHPPLPEGACPRCSTSFSVTTHGGGKNAVCDKDPALPKNILVAALRERFHDGVNVYVVANAVLDALQAAGKVVVDRPLQAELAGRAR